MSVDSVLAHCGSMKEIMRIVWIVIAALAIQQVAVLIRTYLIVSTCFHSIRGTKSADGSG